MSEATYVPLTPAERELIGGLLVREAESIEDDEGAFKMDLGSEQYRALITKLGLGDS